MGKVSVVGVLLDYLKENLGTELISNGLEPINTFTNYQPYYIEEFPEITPLIACYRTKKISG